MPATATQYEHLVQWLRHPDRKMHPVVPFDPLTQRLMAPDFTAANTALTAPVLEDIDLFSHYVERLLADAGAVYGVGGYGEHRTVYSRSRTFDAAAGTTEPRRLHLGTDIWGAVHTPVYAPLAAKVHSTAFNRAMGDYGATIILCHEADGMEFYSLYGHLSLADLEGLKPQDIVAAGQQIGHFGPPEENGCWPPHLHFQLILNLEGNTGDYPGVCAFSKKERYLCNCPDPDSVLQLNRYI